MATPPLRSRTAAAPVLAAVAAGGVVGVAARLCVAAVLSTPQGAFPIATLLVNLGGSLCIGFLLARLEGTDRGLAGPFLATGVLGSFTTYSAFAVETDRLLSVRPGIALAYVLLSVAGGLTMAGVGRAAGGR